MNFKLKYGHDIIEFKLHEKNYMRTLLPNKVRDNIDEEEEIQRALKEPIGSKCLKEIVNPGEKVAIITSDITRPMPSYKVLPPVIKELREGGISEKDITVIFALGSHRSHTESEKRVLAGELVWNSNVRIIDSDMNKCERLGVCKNGTPVDIFKPVLSSDRIICLGNIEFHYFAGYSGGSKALMPGTSSFDAIQVNHANMMNPSAKAGNICLNPVREDIDEITNFINIDFIFNVVLDEDNRIIKAVAGHHENAHREGCRFLDEIYKIPLEKKADIVILSPGGFPKDINLYQSQKGLENAKYAVKEGGILVWCASATEGFGEKTFAEWMLTKTPKKMIEDIQCNFKLGGHKAAAIASILEKNKIFLVSDLHDALIEQIGFVPYKNIQEAVNKAIDTIGDNANVLVMPMAGSTLPFVKTTD